LLAPAAGWIFRQPAWRDFPIGDNKRPWNADADRRLRELLSEGRSHPTIVVELRRSVASISSRLAALRRAERIARKQLATDEVEANPRFSHD
jgi:hypothetical protein